MWVVGVVGKKSIEKSDKVKYWKTNRKRKSPTPWLPGFSRLLLRPLPDISLATWDLAPLSLHHCTKDMLLMKIYRYLSDHREIIETDVKYVETCNLQKVWDSYDSLNGDSCFNLLPRAGYSYLYTIIDLNSIYVYIPNDQRRCFKVTGSRFSACSLIKMMFFCRDILYRLWKQYDHVIIMSKNQSAHSPGSYLINLGAISCKLINHGIKPWGQQ